MKKNILIIAVIVASMIVAVLILSNINNYKSVQFSKQLITAIEKDDIKTVQSIVRQCPNSINSLPSLMPHCIQIFMDYPDVYYPLQEACAWENYDIVKFLIDNGANVNCTYRGLESSAPPLTLIIKAHCKKAWQDESLPIDETTLDIIHLLLENGADKTIKDAGGKTAYDYAIKSNNKDIVSMLE